MLPRVPRTSAYLLLGWAACHVLGGMLTASELRIGGADGFYKPTSVQGWVRFAGRDYKLPLKALREALLENGVVPVISNKIPVKRLEWENLVEDFQFRKIKGDATARGPSNIVFTERGNRYVGRTKRPLIIEQKGRYGFVPVTLRMQTHLPTLVKGDKLTMISPVEIRVLGLTSKGWIRMEATKMDPPPFPPGLELGSAG